MSEDAIEDLCTCPHKPGKHELDCKLFDVPLQVRREIMRLRNDVIRLTRERDEWKKKHDGAEQRLTDKLWEKK